MKIPVSAVRFRPRPPCLSTTYVVYSNIAKPYDTHGDRSVTVLNGFVRVSTPPIAPAVVNLINQAATRHSIESTGQTLIALVLLPKLRRFADLNPNVQLRRLSSRSSHPANPFRTARITGYPIGCLNWIGRLFAIWTFSARL